MPKKRSDMMEHVYRAEWIRYKEKLDEVQTNIESFRQWLTYLIQNAPIPPDEAIDIILPKFEEIVGKTPTWYQSNANLSTKEKGKE